MEIQKITEPEFLPEELATDEDIYSKIEEIISAMDADGVSGIPVKIRKWENNSWEQVTETTADAIPSNHNIGIKYGAGKYQILFTWRSPRSKRGNVMRKVEFALNESYNDLKLQNDRKERAKATMMETPIPAAAGNDQNIMMLLIEQMRSENQRMNTLLVKLIENSNRNSGGGDLQKFYLEDISERARFSMETQREAFTLGLTMGKETGAEDAKQSETMQIVNILAEQAPAIISALTSKRLVKNKLMATPGAREFLQNPAKVQEVYEGLSEKIGVAKAQKIAEKMDLNIQPTANNEIKLKVV